MPDYDPASHEIPHRVRDDRESVMKKTWIVLFLIVLLAGILRFWHLGSVPPSPDWDEAALGYNAYSLLHTGKDEYGMTFPFVFRSFDDYKPGLYIYLVMPFVALFGLTVEAVRMPSALFGVLTVLATYFLVKELFKNQKLALLASFLLAISPWSIQFSRIGFESNVGVAFNVFAALFFLKGLRRPWLLTISAFFAAINLYEYQSEKVFTPLLFVALILIFRKQLFALPKKYFVTAALVGMLITLPLVYYTLTNKEGLARAKGVSVFSEQSLVAQNAQRLIADRSNNDYLGLVFDNRRLEFVKAVAHGYLSHFDLNWLFVTGDLARHHAPFMGLLYLWELPFLLIGIYGLVFGKFDTKAKLFVFSWFLVAPIPASITSGVPHAVRTLNFLPLFQIFVAIGLLAAWQAITNYQLRITNFKIKYVIYVLFALLVIFNFLYYLNQYFIQQNYYNSEEWQYGYQEAVANVQQIQNKYQKIIVSNQPPLDQSYMFFLFYLHYPPAKYQQETKDTSGGFRENHTFGKYQFRPIVWKDEAKRDSLFIGRPQDIPSDAKVIKYIDYLDGKPAIVIAAP